MLPRSRVLLLLLCGALLAPPGAAAAGDRSGRDCLSADAEVDVEEARVSGPVPQEILDRSGFDRFRPALERSLCAASGVGGADRAVRAHGGLLWRAAAARVQGRGPAGGDLARDDDRPLYWARLELSRTVRAWEPGFPVSERQRERLLGTLERASRGQDSMRLPAGRSVRRVVVTGFDPFQLDQDIRRSNPSGAAALALDGRTIRTAAGPARIEVALFPVRWGDFAQGTVEHTLRPHFEAGRRQADLFMTLSQGRPDQFDLERYNGAWRGGYPDNLDESSTGPVPVDGAAGPQWTGTTLPHRELVAGDTGPYPVLDNTSVTEIPAGGGEPVDRPDGPTPGSEARAGGGGDYLSNEIAYRATLLRDRTGLDAPGGHLHTPVLPFAADNAEPVTGTLTDPVFLRARADITAQVRRVLARAVGTLGR